MAKEIEHKFLVKNECFKQLAEGIYYRQGYIPTLSGTTVRIRIAGSQGYITFKDKAKGLSRNEYEYPIPQADAEQMLGSLCSQPQIEKHRYVIAAPDGVQPDGTPATGLHWEVDVFHGENEGLIVAEIEVPSEGTVFEKPDWIGEEVTGNHRYYNKSLTTFPYKDWNKETE